MPATNRRRSSHLLNLSEYTTEVNKMSTSRYLCSVRKLKYVTVRALTGLIEVDCVWNVMAHAQKLDFVFRRNGPVYLNRQLFSWLLAAEVCASAVVMLDTPCSEVEWRVLATHSIRQFPFHFPLPCVTVCHHVSTGLYSRYCDVLVSM